MLRSEFPFIDRQCTLDQRPRLQEVALVSQHTGEIEKCDRSFGIFWPKDLLLDGERTFEQWPRRSKIPLLHQ